MNRVQDDNQDACPILAWHFNVLVMRIEAELNSHVEIPGKVVLPR